MRASKVILNERSGQHMDVDGYALTDLIGDIAVSSTSSFTIHFQLGAAYPHPLLAYLF